MTWMLIVLVHGTTQSPAGWAPLIDHLTALGHEVDALDLAGVDPAEPAAAYALVASGQVRAASADVVVAHSGAGLLLPAIASSLSAKAQVYLAALVPDGRRSFVDELGDDAVAVVHDDWAGVDPTIDHHAARHFLFHDCDDDTADWALTTLRRFAPAGVYAEIVKPVDVPAVVIVPDGDRTIRAAWMTAAARVRLGVEPTTVHGGHCPHVSRPAEVARIIDTVFDRI